MDAWRRKPTRGSLRDDDTNASDLNGIQNQAAADEPSWVRLNLVTKLAVKCIPNKRLCTTRKSVPIAKQCGERDRQKWRWQNDNTIKFAYFKTGWELTHIDWTAFRTRPISVLRISSSTYVLRMNKTRKQTSMNRRTSNLPVCRLSNFSFGKCELSSCFFWRGEESSWIFLRWVLF